MVSLLTRCAVRPCRALSSARGSRAQTPVGCAQAPGLRWASASNCSSPASSQLTWMVWWQWVGSCKAVTLRPLKSRMALRTVWEAQPVRQRSVGGVCPEHWPAGCGFGGRLMHRSSASLPSWHRARRPRVDAHTGTISSSITYYLYCDCTRGGAIRPLRRRAQD